MSAETCIIIPIYNEEKRFCKEAFVRFASSNPHVTFLLVNDGSRDASLTMIRRLESQFPSAFQVLDLTENGGKAEAVRQGVLFASKFDYELIGFWDADLATPLEAICEFEGVLKETEAVDVVIGARLKLLGHRVERGFIRRRIGNCCSLMASLVLGSKIRDSQCGAKLFRATPAMRAAFEAPLHSRWLFDVEILARLANAWQSPKMFAERVFEMPLTVWSEVPGSSLKSTDFVKATWEMGYMFCVYRLGLVEPPKINPTETSSALPAVSAVNRKAA